MAEWDYTESGILMVGWKWRPLKVGNACSRIIEPV